MNYNTIVTPEEPLQCSLREAQRLRRILERAEMDALEDKGGDPHGFRFVREDGDGFLEAEEVGLAGNLPQKALDLIGQILTRNGKEYWEFGEAYTGSRLVPGSHGGTSFRIYADGRLVYPTKEWPPAPGRTKGTDSTAMDEIAAILDGHVWSAQTLDEVASMVRLTGRAVRDPAQLAEEARDATMDTKSHCPKCGCDLHDGRCPEGCAIGAGDDAGDAAGNSADR